MKIFYVLAAISIGLFCNSVSLFAALHEEIESDTAINAVVQERLDAQQEYQAYMLEKTSEMKPPAGPAAAKPSVRSDSHSGNIKDMIIGVVLIFIAIILTIRLYQLSKKKQV